MKKQERNVPKHIAVIPDGNRRWARQHGLALLRGYSIGVKKIIDVSLWAKALGVKTITIWALSAENIKERSRLELRILYELYAKTARDPKVLKMLDDNRVNVKIIGNIRALPSTLRRALASLEAHTQRYSDFTINLLIGYGGRDDMLAACRSAYELGASGTATDIDEHFVDKHIDSASVSDPDLIIRTSGESRLSGLLPWQSTYSELYFENKRWPDFGKADLQRAIATFTQRSRRFGR